MTIPVFQEITLPLLELAADGEVRSLATARKSLAVRFNLSEAEESELLPSGRQSRFANRVAWAKVYLERAGVLASPGRGLFQITARGREILADHRKSSMSSILAGTPKYMPFFAPSLRIQNLYPQPLWSPELRKKP